MFWAWFRALPRLTQRFVAFGQDVEGQLDHERNAGGLGDAPAEHDRQRRLLETHVGRSGEHGAATGQGAVVVVDAFEGDGSVDSQILGHGRIIVAFNDGTCLPLNRLRQ